MSRSSWPEEAIDFLRALGRGLDAEERLITCAFDGDPGDAQPSDWRPRPWGPNSKGWAYRHTMNAYVTVGTFGQAEDGSFRRRAALYRGGLALMVDDVGTKVDPECVAGMPPSARVLTSPGNEQWWYFFDKPEREQTKFDALIRAFIAGPLGGNDPGMASVTRVGRLPGYNNGKAAYGGTFQTKLLELNDKTFNVASLVEGFKLELIGQRRSLPRLLAADSEERVRAHFMVRRFLSQAHMMKRDRPDQAGWTEITCPWVDGHTHGVDNGAAIREPSTDNGFYGGFRCHHGSCAGRGWKELTDWVAEEAAAKLENINEAEE